jgi:LPS-assembly lipoprotein
MGWQSNESPLGRIALAGFLLATATLLAGCFQPLYGDRTPAGTPALRQALAGVEVATIAATPNTPEARIAVQMQNDMAFNLTGGGGPLPPTHRLRVQISGSRALVSASSVSGLPVIENFVLNATYALIEVKTNRQVVTGRASTIVSYDPAGTQRFARLSGLQDAEHRAAKVVADNITTRMASYFYSGS